MYSPRRSSTNLVRLGHIVVDGKFLELARSSLLKKVNDLSRRESVGGHISCRFLYDTHVIKAATVASKIIPAECLLQNTPANNARDSVPERS
jgi:hypothetical protein